MSSFSIGRSENGQAKVTLKNVQDFEIGGVGKVTGSGTFSMGNTGQATNESVIQIGQTKDSDSMLIAMDDDFDNIEFYGENIEASFSQKQGKQYNVQWDAKNSTLDSTKGGGTILLNTHEKSENNTFKLGNAYYKTIIDDKNFDNIIVDNGKSNTFISSENSANLFQTTEKSNDAVIFGGNKSNTFMINGQKASVIGGSGDDEYITGASAKGNMLIGMDGDDSFTDFGDGNLIIGGKGKDTLELNGSNLLANLGNNEDADIHVNAGAEKNKVFTGEELIDKNLTRYNYKDYLNKFLEKNSISMDAFMARAGLNKNASVEDIIEALKGNVL